MDQNTARPASTPAPREPVIFAARDWLALACALGLAVLWPRIFGFYALASSQHIPALGSTVFTAAIWAAVLLYLGKDAKWNPWNGCLAAGVGLLAAAFSLYGDEYVRAINCLLILCGSALAFFSISGRAENALQNVRVLPEVFRMTFSALFANWDKPFRALKSLGPGKNRNLWGILAGSFAALPLLALVIYLLSTADAVFGGLFKGFPEWLESLDAGIAFRRVLRTLLFTLAFFSAIYFLGRPGREKTPEKKKAAAPATPFVIPLILLCAVYAVFDIIQFAFLFGGAETAAMQGGFAEYARSGFFQLVAVSGINLGAILVTSVCTDGRRLLRILTSILLALTWVILFSAFWRMRLYILAYGMSLLRAMTLWAMAFIASSLILAAVKIRRPAFRFWPAFAALGLAGWLVFNFINIDARIADYNVNAYLDGRLEDVDIYYLAKLSPDVLPALERLRDAAGADYTGAGEGPFYEGCDIETAISGARWFYHDTPTWKEWCFSAVRYR